MESDDLRARIAAELKRHDLFRYDGETECRCGWSTAERDPDAVAQLWVAHLADAMVVELRNPKADCGCGCGVQFVHVKGCGCGACR